jgi:hypothetical protein
MSIAEDFRNAAHKVFFLLKHSEECRDDDRILLSSIWKNELGEESNVLKSLEEGKISNPETITRIRRKLQEKYPDLRGAKWSIRHQMEGAVCQQLTFFDTWNV